MRVRTAHVNLQFSGIDEQYTADLEAIFDHAVERRHAWVTGCESGSGESEEDLNRIAEAHGYRPVVSSIQSDEEDGSRFTDCWIAVRKDLVNESDWVQSTNDEGTSVEFLATYPGLGYIHLGGSHFLRDEETLTLTWDELMEQSSNGTRDGRAAAVDREVLDNPKFFSNTNHVYVESLFVVDPLKN